MLGNLVEPENAVVAVQGSDRAAAKLDELFEESEEAGGFVGFGVELAGRCGLGLERCMADDGRGRGPWSNVPGSGSVFRTRGTGRCGR
jgi:hypothetical protein